MKGLHHDCRRLHRQGGMQLLCMFKQIKIVDCVLFSVGVMGLQMRLFAGQGNHFVCVGLDGVHLCAQRREHAMNLAT